METLQQMYRRIKGVPEPESVFDLVRRQGLTVDKHEAAKIGEVRTWKSDGKEHIKTAHGWRLRSAGSDAKLEADCKRRVEAWSSQSLKDENKGLSAKQIYEKYSNTPRPVALVPADILKHFPGITNTALYCGKAYFINHMVNHHPELDVGYYKDIQRRLEKPSKVLLDPNQKSLALAMEVGPKEKELLIIKRDPDKKRLVIYKSLFLKKSQSYPGKFKIINPGQIAQGL